MNMIIHDDGHTNVISYDSLDDFENIQNINKDFKADSFDLILTNPPFGATVKDTEKKYLKNYNLGKNDGRERKNQKTEILFIERCVQFLKPKTGKMAMVLPDGILTNSSLQYVRDFIIEQCHILAVVSLPPTAFSHYGAGVKSSLLFARRLNNVENPGNYPIFMAIADEIGYDATGRETPDKNDLPEILVAFRKFEKENHL
jgi:type I restriction enzyme M protein